MSRAALVGKAQTLLQSSIASMTDDQSEDGLQDLEPPPERDFTWDEVSGDDSDVSRVADDINGLAVSLDSLNSHNASYLGFSSVPTILRVIAHLSPRIRQVVPPSLETLKSPVPTGESPESNVSADIDELSLINEYFLHVHPITPMIDEADFRRRFADGEVPENSKTPWLALFNMVLTMGCFAEDNSQFSKHHFLYKRALSYLSMSSFGSGHIYTVQALALYGGWLLHYLNKPNTACAVMGATLRMAIAMGLHRVQIPRHYPVNAQSSGHSSIVTRIRTWWCIFCLDTWSAATMGRPGLGYWNPGTVLTSSTSSLASMVCITQGTSIVDTMSNSQLNQDYGTISLTANEQFCKIATRIQERLVETPLITSNEIQDFDEELLKWKGSLHVFLSDAQHCPPHLRVARAVLLCRFMTTRLILYRPYLLSAAIHQKPWSNAPQQGGALVVKCLEIARAGVDTIGSDWFPNHMLCWNHAWHLFQISLVLILALASDANGAESALCTEYITKSMDLLAQMEPFDAGATRGRLVIQLLHENIRHRDDSMANINLDASSSLVLDLLDEEMMGTDAEWVNFLCGYN
jgi:hypothetical protein